MCQKAFCQFQHFHIIFLAATIFAYGQTSSGKTFTMRGITEHAVKDIFEHIKNVSHCSYQYVLYGFWNWNPLHIARAKF